MELRHQVTGVTHEPQTLFYRGPARFQELVVIGSDDWTPTAKILSISQAQLRTILFAGPSVNATAAGLTCLLLYGSRGLTVVESNQAPDCLGSPGGE